jgi:pimeloyl-ACP methyl ester carboxylesterase
MPTANVSGRSLHYVETGGGAPTVIFVHGAGGGWGTWTRQLEGLADAGRMIALDLPGHGASPGDGCRAVVDYAAVVQEFARALGAGPVVLAGHSMGGAIAQTIALDSPTLLKGVVLVGTAARLKVYPELLRLLETDYPAAVEFVKRHAWSPAAAPALAEGARKATLEVRQEVTLGDYAACNAFELRDRVAGIRLPTLVIVGEDDELTPPRFAEFLAAEIAEARLVRIAKAGHYVPLEQPDEVNLAIRQFLSTLK